MRGVALQMVRLLAEYRACWEAMRAHICLEARGWELGAQIAALRSHAQHAGDDARRLAALAQQLLQLKQADEADFKCAVAHALHVQAPSANTVPCILRCRSLSDASSPCKTSKGPPVLTDQTHIAK